MERRPDLRAPGNCGDHARLPGGWEAPLQTSLDPPVTVLPNPETALRGPGAASPGADRPAFPGPGAAPRGGRRSREAGDVPISVASVLHQEQSAPSCKGEQRGCRPRSVHHMSSSRDTRAPEGARLGGGGQEGPPARILDAFSTQNSWVTAVNNNNNLIETTTTHTDRPDVQLPRTVPPVSVVRDRQEAPACGPRKALQGGRFSWKRPPSPSLAFPFPLGFEGGVGVGRSGLNLDRRRRCHMPEMAQQKVRRTGVPVGFTSIPSGTQGPARGPHHRHIIHQPEPQRPGGSAGTSGLRAFGW